ncbi:MAG TPA: signal peptidase I [Candidatus Methanomethylophilaceae archaeon]|nr:signal peptidase I [Candidatus Methanomethylophilaceae archaeon]
MDGHKKDRVTLIALVVVIISLFGAGLYSVYSLNDNSLDLRDREVRLVVTGSMDGEPTDYHISTIPVNSLIMVRHMNQEELSSIEVGDVIAFDRAGKMIVHRVIEITSGGDFITKGDANNWPDGTIDSSRVIGKVVGLSPIAGKLVSMAKEWFIWVIMFIILLIVVVYSIREIVRVYRQDDDEEGEEKDHDTPR